MSTPQLVDLSSIDISTLLLLLVKKQELDNNPFGKLTDAVKGLMDAKQQQKSKLLSINNTITNSLLSNNSQSSIPDIKPDYAAMALADYDTLHPNLGLPDYAQLFASSTDMSSLASQLPMSVLMNLAMLGTPTFDTSMPTLLEYQLTLQVNQLANNLETNADSNYQSYLDAKAKKKAKLSNAGNIIGAAGDLVSSFLPEKLEYSGKRGAITAGLDEAYDSISNEVMKLGPAGMLAGGIMKGSAALGKVTNLLGGGTSGMTTTDAILGSSFLNMTPLGLINGFGGKTTSTITKDNEAFAQVGSSYGGTSNTVDEALEVSGKKYGLLSTGARREAERQLAEARRLQALIAGISDDAQIRSTLQGTMSGILSNRYGLQLQGGYNQGAIHAGRKGLKVSPYKARKLTSSVNFKFYLKGGSIIKEGDYLNRLILYAILLNPRFMLRLLEKPTLFVETPDGMPGSHLLMSTDVNGYEIVFPLIQEIDGKLTYIPDIDEAFDRAHKNKDYLKFNSVEDAELFAKHYKEYFPEFLKEFEKLTAPYVDENGKVKHEVEKDEQGTKISSHIEPTDSNFIITTFKEGGSIIESVKVGTIIEPIKIETVINPIELDLIETFLNGGEINVIPDGALHKNLHHMEDAESLTKKGIPVVAIDNGELVAEIETSEIIFRKSVTEKLEELCELYYSEDVTKELKDECTLEAGELLVDEILNNTIDKTNKLL